MFFSKKNITSKLDKSTTLTYFKNVKFIESPNFTKRIDEHLFHDEYVALQWHLATHPESGDLIPGSGGLRKIRWLRKGRGKRGGVRIIYYYKSCDGHIWLLTIYAKNETENIPAHILRKIKEELLK
jgi:mRNA-degrading endonuclease RelE of RelBE toxin-antitoxin system